MAFIEATFGPSRQKSIVLHLVTRTNDEERQATLLVAYYTRHPQSIFTPCCRQGVTVHFEKHLHGRRLSQGTWSCQICMDVLDPRQPEGKKIITAFCSSECPAILCQSCLQEHLRVSLEGVIPGLLPRIRCPICLTPVNKDRWEELVDARTGLGDRYRAICEKACGFRTPCCDNDHYTQLARPYSRSPLERIVVSDTNKHADLEDHVRRFQRHHLTAAELVAAVDESCRPGRHEDDAETIVEEILARTWDDERRATLLLAYHARHKRVTTRCCYAEVCFNCKRQWNTALGEPTHPPSMACEEDTAFSDDCLVECRNCRVWIVKVEGCSDVSCLCGFRMNWTEELELRGLLALGLVPIDVFNTPLYAAWSRWQRNLLAIVRYDLPPRRWEMRRRTLDRLMGPFRPRLRVMAQRYVWRRRFERVRPSLESHLHRAALGQLLRRLRKVPMWCAVVRDHTSRHRRRIAERRLQAQRARVHRQLLAQCPRFEEDTLDDLDRQLAHHDLFG